MRIPITVTKEEAKKLKKLYKGTKNDVKFVEVADEVFDRLEKGKSAFKKAKKIKKDEVLYIDYYGEIIPLHEAVNRFLKGNKQIKNIQIKEKQHGKKQND